MTENSKAYKTLSDIMNAPGRESMAEIARIAPAVETVARKSGIFKLIFSDTVVKASSKAYMQGATKKERDRVSAEMRDLGEQVILKVLKYGLGECLPEMQEIVAAINGISRDELLDNYTMGEIVGMIKAIVGDEGFLSSLRTLTN